MFTDLGICSGHLLRGMPVARRRLTLCVLIISVFLHRQHARRLVVPRIGNTRTVLARRADRLYRHRLLGLYRQTAPEPCDISRLAGPSATCRRLRDNAAMTHAADPRPRLRPDHRRLRFRRRRRHPGRPEDLRRAWRARPVRDRRADRAAHARRDRGARAAGRNSCARRSMPASTISTIGAVKLGMLANAEVIHAVADALRALAPAASWCWIR